MAASQQQDPGSGKQRQHQARCQRKPLGIVAHHKKRDFADPPRDGDPAQPGQVAERCAGEEPKPKNAGDDRIGPALARGAARHHGDRQSCNKHAAAEPQHRQRVRHRASSGATLRADDNSAQHPAQRIEPPRADAHRP